MSAKLHKQCDKAARNNPYSSHKVKGKNSTVKDCVAVDVSKTQPQLKKSAPLATFKRCQKGPASHVNTFVPIPELGIYSPDQHVLRNGTFAQHCHTRDVNNRMSATANSHQGDNNCSIPSSNSSCDETGSNFGCQDKGALRGFNSQDYRHKNVPSADICRMPNSQQRNHMFGQQDMHNLGRRLLRNDMATNNYRRASNSVRSNRNLDNIKKDKLSPSARSHSLSDLSTGLTLSLIGQKKYDSVVSINGHSQVKSPGCFSNSRRHATRAASSLQDIENRFMGTAMSCQSSVTSLSSLYNHSQLQADQDSYNHYSSTSVINGHHQMIHQTKQNTLAEQPYQQKFQNQQLQCSPQQKFQNQQLQYSPQHKPQQQLQREYPVCEDKSNMVQQVSFPRSRKDSDDTTSSHKSALSDVTLFQDPGTKYNNRTNVPAQTSDTSKLTSQTASTLSGVSARNTISGLKGHDTAQPAALHSQLGHLNKGQSVVKPRRSLPIVPLNEASERIKRFTEMMKSRMAANSNGSKSSPADSYSSKYTSPRVSSMGSACSQTGHSVQTPTEPSDSDVCLSANSGHYQAISDQQNGFVSGHNVSNIKPPDICSPRKSSGHCSQSDSGAKSADMSVNGRRHVEEGVCFQNLDHRMNHSSSLETNAGDFCHRNLNQNGWHGQCHNMLSLGEMPLAAADGSLDSGPTTETTNSYNGSVLDSGYTTNNDGENDSCRSNPPRLSHYHHNTHQEYPQHADQHNEISRSRSRNDETPHCNYHHTRRYSTNLVNSNHFGSVQNIYPQPHGNSKDLELQKCNHIIINDKHQELASQSPVCCYQTMSNKNISESTKNGSIAAAATVRNMLPVNRLQLQDLTLSANRRSWDCANDAQGSFSQGFRSDQIQRYGRVDERYRSSDVLPSSRGFVGGNSLNNHQTGRIHTNEYQQLKTSKQSKASSENSASDSEIAQLNGLKGFTPLTHSLNSEPKPGRDLFNHRLGERNHGHAPKPQQASYNGNLQLNGHQPTTADGYQISGHQPTTADGYQLNGHQPTTADGYQISHHYKISNGIHKQQDEVKPQQVPASRVSRLARGYTHPGGFGTSESDCTFQRYSTLAQEMSLFHMTQKYDLSPVLINLPPNTLLKDMIELDESSVEMSLVGVSPVPNSFHGKAPQIGTPGSAFTPVKHSVDRDKPLTSELQVTCFSGMCHDVHKYTTLGRLLTGDIVIEVNGWFCLGADVVYVRKIIENCTEAVTLTVARLKESDDIRFKGQTAIERIKGLESEISRLDDLIQARDDRIKNLTVATEAVNFKHHHTGTLSEINGRIPLEGMVIGGDEYVV